MVKKIILLALALLLLCGLAYLNIRPAEKLAKETAQQAVSGKRMISQVQKTVDEANKKTQEQADQVKDLMR